MANAEPTVSTRDRPTGAATARHGGNGARPLGRRRALPGGRAVAGAFLIALALVGVFAAYTSATADTREHYVIASHDLRIGQPLRARDLAVARMDLPGDVLGGRVFQDPDQLIGAVIVGPVSKGELIQASDVVAKGGEASDYEISVPIAAARSVAGTLVPGDRVDVAATFGSGAEAFTVYVVRHAKVIARSEARGSLGSSDGDVITLALATEQDALAVSYAFTAGQVSLVRSSGTPAPTTPVEPYRAPASRPVADGGDDQGKG